MTEEIGPAGIITEENEEIRRYVGDHNMTGLHRISFWQSRFRVPRAKVCRSETCVGYAILKCDEAASKSYHKWHVFEAVFKKYPHVHNCVPRPMRYEVALGGVSVRVDGLLYAQQNQLNKSCAQVALRSLLSRVTSRDVSYSEINDLARKKSRRRFDPANGLNATQIRAVLQGFGVGFRDFDYTQFDDEERRLHPYQKYVYSGVESGCGALVGFHLTGPATTGQEAHIIPFYGHTFNKDTWAPEADVAYFRVGDTLGYLPSENWTSSFLGHDDNFGPNFCVPRLYILPDQVDYVVELLRPGIVFGGAQAEALSLQFLDSALREADQYGVDNDWLRRLGYYFEPPMQRVVLRALALDRGDYVHHLKTETDWDRHSENAMVIDVLSRTLPERLWVVEASIPQLFPANERKLGEIVLNGGIELRMDGSSTTPFLLARLPGLYLFKYFGEERDFLALPSNLASHLPVFRL
jgi:hypothetical protein